MVRISLGALAPPLREQLREQGVVLKEDDGEHLERDLDAITRLYVRGLLTDAERHKAGQRLMKKLAKVPVVESASSEGVAA